MASNTSLTQAINFLTRPLIPIYAPAMINNLQHILRSTLNAAYPPSHTKHFTLSFSAANHPPRPIYATCIATGILWSDWIRLLSQSRAFDLLVEPNSVIVRFVGQTITIWTQAPLTEVKRSPLSQQNYEDRQIPISKFAQHHHTRTLAQQILDSNHEEEEADELFALISDKTRGWIVSPTPTREKFVIPSLVMPVVSPLSSPEPSSRSSSRSSSTVSDSENELEERVFVDSTKKEVTKYLYQGGVSSVLTGGVMLGKAKPTHGAPSWRRRV